MNMRHFSVALMLAVATLTTVLSNAAAYLPWGKLNGGAGLALVNEASRVAHAKELLGGKYPGSVAQRIEGKKSLNMHLQKKVQNSLAPRWKAQAPVITQTVIAESAKYHLDPIFVLAVIKTESKFDPLARGSFGEIGLMQIKPSTARWIAEKYKLPWHGERTLESPSANIRIGLAYMNYLRTKFNNKALRYVSAYNMGPNNVHRLLARNIKPAEYNSRVMKNYFEIYSLLSQNLKTGRNLVASN